MLNFRQNSGAGTLPIGQCCHLRVLKQKLMVIMMGNLWMKQVSVMHGSYNGICVCMCDALVQSFSTRWTHWQYYVRHQTIFDFLPSLNTHTTRTHKNLSLHIHYQLHLVKSRKEKKSEVEKAFDNVVTSFAKFQAEADEKYEKREECWKKEIEREERRHKEDQQQEMHMMQMLVQRRPYPPPLHYYHMTLTITITITHNQHSHIIITDLSI